MNKKTEGLIAEWKREEEIAYVHGWDFSHIEGGYEEKTEFYRDYKGEVLSYLKPDMKLLDIDTGGGEFLLSLGHPYENTSVSEGYLPNFELCRNTLTPLGITVKYADAEKFLPFENGEFDIVINRHGSFLPDEIYRVLKNGGMFITQQVGAYNDRELVELLCGENTVLPFPGQVLKSVCDDFIRAGFTVTDSGEYYGSLKFFDVGALVWFARIISWEFPDFSVDNNLDALIRAQEIIEKFGFAEGKTHRFFLAARK